MRSKRRTNRRSNRKRVSLRKTNRRSTRRANRRTNRRVSRKRTNRRVSRKRTNRRRTNRRRTTRRTNRRRTTRRNQRGGLEVGEKVYLIREKTKTGVVMNESSPKGKVYVQWDEGGGENKNISELSPILPTGTFTKAGGPSGFTYLSPKDKKAKRKEGMRLAKAATRTKKERKAVRADEARREIGMEAAKKRSLKRKKAEEENAERRKKEAERKKEKENKKQIFTMLLDKIEKTEFTGEGGLPPEDKYRRSATDQAQTDVDALLKTLKTNVVEDSKSAIEDCRELLVLTVCLKQFVKDPPFLTVEDIIAIDAGSYDYKSNELLLLLLDHLINFRTTCKWGHPYRGDDDVPAYEYIIQFGFLVAIFADRPQEDYMADPRLVINKDKAYLLEILQQRQKELGFQAKKLTQEEIEVRLKEKSAKTYAELPDVVDYKKQISVVENLLKSFNETTNVREWVTKLNMLRFNLYTLSTSESLNDADKLAAINWYQLIDGIVSTRSQDHETVEDLGKKIGEALKKIEPSDKLTLEAEGDDPGDSPVADKGSKPDTSSSGTGRSDVFTPPKKPGTKGRDTYQRVQNPMYPHVENPSNTAMPSVSDNVSAQDFPAISSYRMPMKNPMYNPMNNPDTDEAEIARLEAMEDEDDGAEIARLEAELEAMETTEKSEDEQLKELDALIEAAEREEKANPREAAQKNRSLTNRMKRDELTSKMEQWLDNPDKGEYPPGMFTDE
jgi:hypothetical protein